MVRKVGFQFAKCAVKVSVAPKVNENVEEEGILATYMKQIEELKEQLKVMLLFICFYSDSFVVQLVMLFNYNVIQYKEEADNKEEEKKKRLDELLRLILVGGENKKESFQVITQFTYSIKKCNSDDFLKTEMGSLLVLCVNFARNYLRFCIFFKFAKLAYFFYEDR